MIQTNIVFWLVVVAALAAVWFLMSFCFKDIGKWLIDLLNDVMKQLKK